MREKMTKEGLLLFEKILRANCGRNCGGQFIHSFIQQTHTYIDEERGMRRFYSFKPCKRKSKGTRLVIGGEWRRAYEGKSFEDRDSPQSSCVSVSRTLFTAKLLCISFPQSLFSGKDMINSLAL